MHHFRHYLVITLSLVLFLPLLSQAEPGPVERLSPELRSLLSKEMLAIQEGMMAIVPAYSSGNNDEIETIARQIKNSFIIKRSLTAAQKQELLQLPPAFLTLDRQFHYNAGMLEDAASKNKPELIGFYITQLSEACAGCHSQFARHKFPRFNENDAAQTHSH